MEAPFSDLDQRSISRGRDGREIEREVEELELRVVIRQIMHIDGWMDGLGGSSTNSPAIEMSL